MEIQLKKGRPCRHSIESAKRGDGAADSPTTLPRFVRFFVIFSCMCVQSENRKGERHRRRQSPKSCSLHRSISATAGCPRMRVLAITFNWTRRGSDFSICVHWSHSSLLSVSAQKKGSMFAARSSSLIPDKIETLWRSKEEKSAYYHPQRLRVPHLATRSIICAEICHRK